MGWRLRPRLPVRLRGRRKRKRPRRGECGGRRESSAEELKGSEVWKALILVKPDLCLICKVESVESRAARRAPTCLSVRKSKTAERFPARCSGQALRCAPFGGASGQALRICSQGQQDDK